MANTDLKLNLRTSEQFTQDPAVCLVLAYHEKVSLYRSENM